MNKLEKIEHEAQKARERIAAAQTLLKQIEGQRTEQENLQIIQQVRALKLSRDELYAFLSGGALPTQLIDSVATQLAEPETIYSRRSKQRQQTEPDTPGGEPESSNNESEGINSED